MTALDHACEAARQRSIEFPRTVVTVYDCVPCGAGGQRRGYVLIDGPRPRLLFQPGACLWPIISYRYGTGHNPYLAGDNWQTNPGRGSVRERVVSIRVGEE